MTSIVILQPQFFPWAGVFEQIRLTDTYLHFDDVQVPQGRSFLTRVQIKSPSGINWLTVPIRRDQKIIRDVQIDYSQNWIDKHYRALQHAYSKAPFWSDLCAIVRPIYESRPSYLAELNCRAIEDISNYLGLTAIFSRSSSYDVALKSSEKLLALVKKVQANTYITGHGAKNYLDHALFEQSGVRVEYMDYMKLPYPQLNGTFTPYVSVLDLIANCGPESALYLRSGTVYWKDMPNE
jgi:hypothetical protein